VALSGAKWQSKARGTGAQGLFFPIFFGGAGEGQGLEIVPIALILLGYWEYSDELRRGLFGLYSGEIALPTSTHHTP
jgi:hypothetical protein